MSIHMLCSGNCICGRCLVSRQPPQNGTISSRFSKAFYFIAKFIFKRLTLAQETSLVNTRDYFNAFLIKFHSIEEWCEHGFIDKVLNSILSDKYYMYKKTVRYFLLPMISTFKI